MAPKTTQVWVDLNDDGTYQPGQKSNMSEVDSQDTTYTDGKLYSRPVTITALGDWSLKYRFYATDGLFSASGTATADQTLSVIPYDVTRRVDWRTSRLRTTRRASRSASSARRRWRRTQSAEV